jgi:hypothetical protein
MPGCHGWIPGEQEESAVAAKPGPAQIASAALGTAALLAAARRRPPVRHRICGAGMSDEQKSRLASNYGHGRFGRWRDHW